MRDWVRPAIIAGFAGFILGGASVSAIIGTMSAQTARDFATGAGVWLNVIPQGFYDLISFLGVGYIAARSADKFTDAKKAQAEADAVKHYSEAQARRASMETQE
ncbi:hypothetical protein GCM10007897_15280 [Sphingobium jiangsuense]|uniref:Uncharacterized protein n=1 Tax=Sphingobium jiangsuense TaxID=870476 RepID=A0A7W6BHB7_9SPHN|nr:hypothetical protein [Sphingobium jiangsuense]MBB3925026.1 hypothetical protein [Sphingobium jiangsuense]GLT00144.1 hypothetical protein GCM10007897_15280 [Sphingobium jiangsuense]